MGERSARHLTPLFQEMHEALEGSACQPPPVITWYSYVSTKSTIRQRDGRWKVRVSDHLIAAPDDAIRGLFGMLICRIKGRSESSVDADLRRAYDDFVDAPALQERREQSAARRGRKHLDPVGAHRSLLESYLRVVTTTGLDVPEVPRLSWSKTRSRRRFGHHDKSHGVIVLSRALDDPKVPEFVLDYVVYHELLHIAYPPIQGSGGKRIIHHKRFRQEEARFPQRKEAERWLTRLSSG